MGLVKEFKEFAIKGNVMDLAVGVIIGGAFGKIVSSLVDDVLMPVLGKLTGGVDFSNKFLQLAGDAQPTLAAAKAAGATMSYGVFLNSVFNFLMVALAVFLFIVKPMNKMKNEAPAVPAPGPSAEEKLLTEIRDALKSR